MFKSKIFLKAMLIVSSIIVVYTMAIYLFAIPKIDDSIQSLEKKKSKEILNKVTILTKNVNKNLQNYKKTALQNHKNELKNLTDTTWSIIQAKYEQSKPQNIGSILKVRGDEFKSNLMSFYNKNKDKMDEKDLKNAIKNYISIHRYNNNTGYFFINKETTTVLHPIKPSLNGRDLKDLKDKDGVYFIQEFVNICNKKNAGIVKYKWENPKTKHIEDKITYVFKFEPYGWIIGTGEYYSVLKKRLQKEVIELVNKLRYADNNYFFISDYHSVLISHPYLQGKDFSNVIDKKGNLIVPPMVKIAREKGEGFTSYWWKKNKKDNKIFEKLSFSKDFPDWKMVIGTGVYIDDINKEVAKRKKELMQQLRQIVKTTKIGKTGYLYIFNGDAKMLIHPNSNVDGKNFSKLKNPTKGTYIFDDLLEASKTTKELIYKWDKPTDKGNYIYDKVSWIEYIPELDWYVVSSAYLDEFKESSNEVVNFITILALFIFVVSVIYSFMFFRNLLIPILNISQLALKVTGGNYDVRCTLDRDDEMGILSKEFNKMVEKIRDNIENLDIKVKEKTKELSKSNKNIKDSIEYASIIQQAILPSIDILDNYTKDNFVIWQPRDIVGGDIYFIVELKSKNEILIMVIDGAGHGVPGAFVTMLVKAIETQIVSRIKDGLLKPSPAKILEYFNKSIKTMLKQKKGSKSNAGFDGGILYYNKTTKECKYAGAKTDLYIIDDDKLNIINGDKKNVGFVRTKIDQKYTEHTVDIKEDTRLYITTDGIFDQEGENKARYGIDRFESKIVEVSEEPFDIQKNLILDSFNEFKQNIRQTDDVTIVGLKF